MGFAYFARVDGSRVVPPLRILQGRSSAVCATVLLAMVASLLALPHPLLAAVVVDPGGTGATDVYPADPSTWAPDGWVSIGDVASGALRVDGASRIESRISYIGCNSGSNGTVTIDGAGSAWNSPYLYVGNNGNGTLWITNGGAVASTKSIIGHQTGATGTATIDGPGSIWTTGQLFVGYAGSGTLNIANGGLVVTGLTWVDRRSSDPCTINFNGGTLDTISLDADDTELAGTGTIIVHNLMVDGAMVLDSPDDLTQPCRTINSLPDQNIEVYYNIDGQGSIRVGKSGADSLTIRNGLTVASTRGFIGTDDTVTVEGPGSVWSNRGDLQVGSRNSGTLNIANGGRVVVGGLTDAHRGGTIHFNGGVLDTVGLHADDADLEGTGTIILHDIGINGAMVLDSPDDLQGNLRTINSRPGQNITVDYNIDGQGSFCVGAPGDGSLAISNGLTVTSANCFLGCAQRSSGTLTVEGPGSALVNEHTLFVGYEGSDGTLEITGGGAVYNGDGYIGDRTHSSSAVKVDGLGSMWSNRGELHVGYTGSGALEISGGATVSNNDGYLGYHSNASAAVTVDGPGSTWTNHRNLVIGRSGRSTLEISRGGLVRVAGTLTIGNQCSYINMSTGGMLALLGDADDSLDDFLEPVEGERQIRYWDDSIADWADIAGATRGEDYTLRCLSEGDLAGYTLLTVGAVPEPSLFVSLLGLSLILLRRR